MDLENGKPKVASKGLYWTGWVISVLVFLMMVMGASMGLTRQEFAVKGFVELGYPEGVLVPLAAVQLACAILYVVPQTGVLGAILLTAYLGGATATHVRASQPFFMPVLVGVLVWLGLLLRERRLWSLLPIRRNG